MAGRHGRRPRARTPLACSSLAASLIDEPGARDLLVRVHRPGLPDATARAAWVVGSGAAADAPAPPSAGRPLDGLVAPPAAALAALAVGLAIVAWSRRRPGSIASRGGPAWREP